MTIRISQLLPVALILLLAISAIYAISFLNFFWMFIAITALVVSVIPGLKGGTMFGAWNLWVPAIISGPYVLGFVSYEFGFEPFDLKSPIFWVIGSMALFSLSIMLMGTLTLTKVRLNTSFTVIFTFVLYEALLAMQGPIDLYLNGHIGTSYFEDNMVLMGYLIVCSVIGLALTAVIRTRLGLITLFQRPEKGSWGFKHKDGFWTTVFFTLLLISLIIISQIGRNGYSLWTGVISILLMWTPQALDMGGLIRLPHFVIIIIGLSLFLNSFGVVTGLYDDTFWWDKLTHIISGFAVAAIATVALLILQNMNKISVPPYWYVFFIFIIVMFFEATWEIIEFVLDNTVGTSMQYGKMDTVNDLMSDSISGIVAGAGSAYYVKRNGSEDYIARCEAERMCQIFDSSL
ncbi:MAG: hypothetical protein LLG16_09480 [Euryarchaeota archaeon]|nr:hypothetical protein [Euryarchaeota archaeon]